MKEDCPTFERIRFFATAPGPDGDPWLRLPRTFFLEDPDEYFQTDVVPRACWSVAHKKGANPLPGLRAGAEDGLLEDPKFPPKAGGTEADVRPEPKGGKAGKSGVKDMAKLLGPQLTAKEGARSLDHRPKDEVREVYLLGSPIQPGMHLAFFFSNAFVTCFWYHGNRNGHSTSLGEKAKVDDAVIKKTLCFTTVKI